MENLILYVFSCVDNGLIIHAYANELIGEAVAYQE
jgi:hypothetical protein